MTAFKDTGNYVASRYDYRQHEQPPTEPVCTMCNEQMYLISINGMVCLACETHFNSERENKIQLRFIKLKKIIANLVRNPLFETEIGKGVRLEKIKILQKRYDRFLKLFIYYKKSK